MRTIGRLQGHNCLRPTWSLRLPRHSLPCRSAPIQAVRFQNRWATTQASQAPPSDADCVPRIGLACLFGPGKHSYDYSKAFSAWRHDNPPIGLSKESRSPRHLIPKYTTIIRNIDNGNILQAMTDFTSAVAYDRSNLRQHIINDMIHRLAHVTSRSSMFDTRTVQETYSKRIWIPLQLQGSDIEAHQVPPSVLSIYAIATVFDIGALYGFTPSSNAMAKALYGLQQHVDSELFLRCTKLVLLVLQGMPLHEAQSLHDEDINALFAYLDADKLSPRILTAICEGLSKNKRHAQHWDLLAWWLHERGAAKQPDVDKYQCTWSIEEKEDYIFSLPYSCWPTEAYLWNIFIRMYGRRKDFAGVRRCTRHYYKTMQAHEHTAQPGPFIENLRLCLSLDNKVIQQADDPLLEDVAQTSVRKSALEEAMQFAKDCGMEKALGLPPMLLSYHVNIESIENSASLVLQMHRQGALRRVSPDLCKALFKLHKVHAIRGTDGDPTAPIFQHLESDEPFFATLRRLLCFFVSRNAFASAWKPEKKVEALNEALAASLAANDLPSALLIVRTMEWNGLKPSKDTLFAFARWFPRVESRLKFRSLQAQTQSPAAVSDFADHLYKESAECGHPFIGKQTSATTQSSAPIPLFGRLLTDGIAHTVRSALFDRAYREHCAKHRAAWVLAMCTEIQKQHPDGGSVNQMCLFSEDTIVSMALRPIVTNEQGRNLVGKLFAHLFPHQPPGNTT